MPISHDDVRHVAHLARLALDDEQVAALQHDLAEIVGYVEQLQEVDVTDVEPVANVSGLANVTRRDEAGAMLPRERILAGAPKANAEAILVPKAVER